MSRKRARPEVWLKVAIERDGKTYHGEYAVTDARSVTHGELTLRSRFGEKQTQVGGMEPEDLARMMLAIQVTTAERPQ
jgi:hypothetical protein